MPSVQAVKDVKYDEKCGKWKLMDIVANLLVLVILVIENCSLWNSIIN